MREKILLILYLLMCMLVKGIAQELDCRVTVNSSQIQGTNKDVFKNLETTLSDFINTHKWTQLQFESNERIRCSLTFLVKEYDEIEGRWICELTVQSMRPVYHSTYQTVIFSHKDNEVTFNYREFDALVLKNNQVDNNLVGIISYYAYLIIGLDLDTMAIQGGTTQLRQAENIVTMAQLGGEIGWTAFENSRNRYALVADYLDEGMFPFRQLMYNYHRRGLDEFTINSTRTRTFMTENLGLLKIVQENKPLSSWPILFTEIKKDELINLYSSASQKEKNEVVELFSIINPSLITEWENIKK